MTIEPCAQAVLPAELTLSVRRSDHTTPGGGVSLCCRIHNRSRETIVGAMLRFVLPPEVIVAASDPAGSIVPPLEPGETSITARDVLVHGAIGDGTELRFVAALSLPGGRLQCSNVAALCLHSRARLDGPGTFVCVAPTDTPQELLVQAYILNDGSATARAVTIDLPAPAGTRPLDALVPTSYTFDALEPGTTRSFAYRVRIAAPAVRSVRATVASLCDGAGNRIALPPSPNLPLAAAFSPPRLSLIRDGRRLRVNVCGTNAGPGSAHGVEFALRWPGEFNCRIASLTWNAARVGRFDRSTAFARAQVRAGGADVAIAAIDAGEAYELGFEIEATATAGAGTLAVDMRADECTLHTEATLHWAPHTDIRLRIVATPDAAVDTGTCAHAIVELFNAGDNDSTVTLELDGAPAHYALDGAPVDDGTPLALAAGDCVSVTVAIAIPPDLRDGELLALLLVVRVHGEDVAQTAITVQARCRVWIDTREWFVNADGVSVVQFMNTGTTIARNAMLLCNDGGRIEIGDIVPGVRRRLSLSDIDGARVADGARLIIDGQPELCLQASEAEFGRVGSFDAIVSMPARAFAGDAVAVTLQVVCTQPTRRLSVLVQALPEAKAVAGSLTVDDRAAGDYEGVPLLYGPGGLVLHDIAAGAHIELRWKLLPYATSASGLRIRVDLDADGAAKRVFSQHLIVDGRPSELIADAAPAQRLTADRLGPEQLPANPGTPQALGRTGPCAGAVTLFVTLDRGRIDACIGLLQANAMSGVFAHIASLRALFPTGSANADDAVTKALPAARAAFETLFDRLALKLRMPNFRPTLRDCEDADLRRALVGLLTACALYAAADSPACETQSDGSVPVMHVCVTMQWAEQQIAQLSTARLGDGAVLSTIIAMMPAAANRLGLHQALEHYAALLRVGLLDTSGTPPTAACDSLDAARNSLLNALTEVRRELELAI